MRCEAMGAKSYGQCRQRALKDGKYCSYHQKIRTPKLPPDERIELLDEYIACRQPLPKATPPKRHITAAEYRASPDDFVVICKGAPTESIVPRCAAKSKRSGTRCRNASCRGGRTCRMHGGKSTGPRTEVGKANCGQHFFKHGRETRAIRRRVRQKHAELSILQRMIWEYEF